MIKLYYKKFYSAWRLNIESWWESCLSICMFMEFTLLPLAYNSYRSRHMQTIFGIYIPDMHVHSHLLHTWVLFTRADLSCTHIHVQVQNTSKCSMYSWCLNWAVLKFIAKQTGYYKKEKIIKNWCLPQFILFPLWFCIYHH